MSPQDAFRNERWAIPTINTTFSLNWRDVFQETPDTQVLITMGNWPADAISDINNARAELQSRGYVNADFVLVAPDATLKILDAQITNTDITYRQFLLQNGLIESTFISDNEEVILRVHGADLNARGFFIGSGAGGTQRSRFSDEVAEKAWKLLEEYMEPNQYFAFMEKTTIELENKATTFRLLINKDGKFTILEGERGAGIVASSGRIKSYEYPLGDEIAVFIDWFRYKTKELIAQWNCGTYGIVKEGQRR